MKPHRIYGTSLILALGCSLATGCGLPERLGSPPKEEPAPIDDYETFARHAINQIMHAKRGGNEDRLKRWEAVLKAHTAKRRKMNDEIEEEMLRKAEERVK